MPSPSARELFFACLDLPDVVARDAYLAQHCADGELRAQVQRLLAAHHDEHTRFLEAEPPRAPLGEQAGDTIDRYVLQQPIGEGGMGTVWLAEQRTPVVRQVALKIVKLGMDTRDVVARFEAERQALARMDHPHIAKVFDAGATPSGRPFFVMERVAGEPVTDYCDRQRLSLPDRLLLFGKVCEAIQHAHHKGVIHRDIKPGNVLVATQDGNHVPKVIDFGIAKATQGELTIQTLRTLGGMILGTPAYMAPEQTGGGDVDTRVDVYALGVLLYELLTGSRPIDVGAAWQAGVDELLRTIRDAEPPRPSTRVQRCADETISAARRQTNVRTWSQHLRGDLDWIVMKAIEKDRTRRYATPSALADDVARFLRQEAVLAAPPSAGYRLRKFVARRRALVAGVVGTSLGLVRAQEERDRAEAAGRLQQRIAEFQGDMLAGLDPVAMGAGLQAQLLAGLPEAEQADAKRRLRGVDFAGLSRQALDENLFQRSLRAVDERFADDPATRVHLLRVVGDTMRGLGLVPASLPVLQRAHELAQPTLGRSHPTSRRVLQSLASAAYDVGDHGLAERTARDLLAALRNGGDADSVAEAHARFELGRALAALRRDREAELELSTARELYVRTLGPTAERVFESWRGAVLTGDPQQCVARLREVLAAQEAALGGEHVDTLGTVRQLAMRLAASGEEAAAWPLLERAAAGYLQRLGPSHPRTLSVRTEQAELALHQGRPGEAVEHARAAFEGLVAAVGLGHAECLRAALVLGGALVQQRDLPAAELVLREAVASLQGATTVGDSVRCQLLQSLGGLRLEQRRPREALPLLREAYEVSLRLPESASTLPERVARDHAFTLWNLGDAGAAVPVWRRVVQLVQARRGPDHLDTLRACANLGVNLLESGEAALALESLQRVYGALEAQPALAWVGVPMIDAALASGRVDLVRQEAPKVAAWVQRSTERASERQVSELLRLVAALADVGAFAEAEPIARSVQADAVALDGDGWLPWLARCELGVVLAGLGKPAEAVPFLDAGLEGLLAWHGSERAAADGSRPHVQRRIEIALLQRVATARALGDTSGTAAWQQRLETFRGR